MKAWHQYSWRKKNRALLIGSFLFALITYQLAVKNTLRLRHNFMSNREQSDIQAQTQNHIKQLEHELAISAFDGLGESTTVFSEKEHLVTLAHESKVKATNLSETVTVKDEQSSTDYNAYYFSASFVELLTLLDRIEREQKMNLLNVSFFKQKNNISQQWDLIMKIETAKINAN